MTEDFTPFLKNLRGIKSYPYRAFATDKGRKQFEIRFYEGWLTSNGTFHPVGRAQHTGLGIIPELKEGITEQEIEMNGWRKIKLITHPPSELLLAKYCPTNEELKLDDDCKYSCILGTSLNAEQRNWASLQGFILSE